MRVVDARKVVWFELQKTIESTWSEKVVEKDGEEAMEVTLRSLVDFLRIWRRKGPDWLN